MIDLTSVSLFDWKELKEMLKGEGKTRRVRIVVSYMNRFYAYIIGGGNNPIVAKKWNQEEKKCEIYYMDVKQFLTLHQNKAVKAKEKNVSIDRKSVV